MNSEKGSGYETIRTSYTPEELKKIDRKLHQQDLERQKALKENPPVINKKIIGIGKKRDIDSFYRLKPSRPFWDKKKSS